MQFIVCLLALTLVTELMAHYLEQADKPFAWIYYIFVFFDFSLLCAYYIRTGGTQRRKWVGYVIPLFIVAGLATTFSIHRFQSFFSNNMLTIFCAFTNLTIAGALLFVMYTHLLFNLDSTSIIPVYRHTNFWIAIGILLFYGGAFLYNGVYAQLLQLNQDETLKLFGKINRPLNLLLYSCFIIGILCSLQKLKYTTQ